MLNRVPEPTPLMEDIAQCRVYTASVTKYNDHLEYVKLYKQMLDIKEGRIADLGSGCCTFIIALARAYPQLTFDCYEMSDAMIRIAKEQVEQNLLQDRINIIKQDILTVSGDYDAILCNRTLHHVNDTETFWNTISNLNTKILITDAVRPNSIEDLNRIVELAGSAMYPQEYLNDFANTLRACYSDIELTTQLSELPYNPILFEEPSGIKLFAIINTL